MFAWFGSISLTHLSPFTKKALTDCLPDLLVLCDRVALILIQILTCTLSLLMGFGPKCFESRVSNDLTIIKDYWPLRIVELFCQ